MDDYWKDVGLGKGAWQCDARGGREILPQDEAAVFEEIPSADAPRFALLPSVPTVAARVDDRHVAVFFDGCRYRCEFDVDVGTVGALTRALCVGGLGQGAAMTTGARRKLDGPESLVLFYSGTRLDDDARIVGSYGVPRGCKILLGIDRALVERAEAGLGPGEDDDYWA
jgi:hypothetical protein